MATPSGFRSEVFTPGGLVYVSFYTPKYAEMARNLVESLKRFGAEYDVRPIKLDGKWQTAVRYKPTFMRDMLREHHRARGIVWVDADAEQRRPWHEAENTKKEFAIKVRPWPVKKYMEPICSLIFIRRTERMFRFMEEWIRRTEKIAADCETPEQVSLNSMLYQRPGGPPVPIQIKWKPFESSCSAEVPDRVQSAAFWQFQASRHINPQQIKKRTEKAKAAAEARALREEGRKAKEAARQKVRKEKEKAKKIKVKQQEKASKRRQRALARAANQKQRKKERDAK